LENVGHNLLGNLQNLKEADFSDNPCISKFADSSYKIAELNQELLTRCPLLATSTTSPQTTTKSPECCELRCSLNGEVEYLWKDTLKMQEQLDNHDLAIQRLILLVASLSQNVVVSEASETAVEEIEKELRVMQSGPIISYHSVL
jgi:hypothetical protein